MNYYYYYYLLLQLHIHDVSLKKCTITMIRFVFLRSIIITMMINRSLVKQSNRFKKKEREKSVHCQYQTVFVLLSCVIVKPNANKTRLFKWVLKTISTFSTPFLYQATYRESSLHYKIMQVILSVAYFV